MKILKFSLPTCKHCITFSEQMKKLDLSNFEIQEINLQIERELSKKYGIRKVPTLVILDKEDNEVGRIVDIKQLESFIRIEQELLVKEVVEKVKTNWINKLKNIFKLKLCKI